MLHGASSAKIGLSMANITIHMHGSESADRESRFNAVFIAKACLGVGSAFALNPAWDCQQAGKPLVNMIALG